LLVRRSPQLTPASLAARRANALKSTGPRTAAGKARARLNALRHGRRARDLRAKLARIGDSEALFLLDWFHHHMLWFWRPRKERTCRYTVRLAARAWCFMNGLGLRPRVGETQEEADRKRACPTYRYGQDGDARLYPERPSALRIGYKRGPAIKFLKPTPTRRKHLLLGWLPEFQHVPGPTRKANRVRRVGPEDEESHGATRNVDSRPLPSRRLALCWDDVARFDSDSSLWQGQALVPTQLGGDVAGFETPSPTVIPAKSLPPRRRGAGIHEFSYELLPVLEGGTKNLVQTKLEYDEESITCQDSGNPWVEMAFALGGGGLQGGFGGVGLEGGLNAQSLDGRAPPSLCELTFDDEEPWMFMDLDDSVWEVVSASRALIELQWGKWRQAVNELKSTKDLLPGGGGGASTAQTR